MALPKLLQKLFTNGGAGDKLNQDIIPVLNTASRNFGETSMVQLGFAKDSTVTIRQFFQKLFEKGYTASNSVLKFNYSYVEGAYVTDGTNTVRIGGGTLYLGQNGSNPSSDYHASWGLFVPPHGTRLYRIRTYKDNEQDVQNIYTYESGGLHVGFLALYAGSNVPDGWFRCDGSTIDNMATNYPQLYAILGTNVLPNYSGRVPLGASSAINTTVNAGLPNINGKFVFHGFMEDGSGASVIQDTTGVFEAEAPQNSYAYGSPHSNATSYAKVGIDASRSSSIYGSSTTVQPPAVKVAVLIRHD